MAGVTLAAIMAVGASTLSAHAQEETGSDDQPQMEEMAVTTHIDDLAESLETMGHTAFVDLMRASGLDHEFMNEEGLTLFVPSNQAFSELADGAIDREREARELVLYHAAAGHVEVEAMQAGEQNITSLAPFAAVGGVGLMVSEDGETMIRDIDQTGRVIDGPLWVGDTMIYIIDEVLLPNSEDV